MKYFFILFLFLTTLANAQLSDKQLKEIHDNTAKIESTTVKLNEIIIENQRVSDSIEMARFNEQNIRNLNSFMASRKKQERKQQQRMYWQSGFGILMFVILIAGWRRRKKQQV